MKIGLMSFAHPHSLGYARLLSAMPGIELMASDPDYRDRAHGESGGPELAAVLGVAYLDTYAELLDWKPDAVVICSENVKHRADTELAAAAGAHVLCEKPMATSLHDGEAMIAACEAAAVSLMIAFPVRFSPAFRDLKSSVDHGNLGEVLTVNGTNNGKVPTDRAWFTDKELAGGGAMTDHTVHIADMLDELFGAARVTTVYASTNDVLHPDRDVETAGLVSLTYDNGVTAVIDCSWSRPEHYPVWGGLTMQVIGTEGILEINPFAQRVDGYSEADRAPLWLTYGTDTDALMLREFITAIREGRAPEPGAGAGYRTLQVVQAAYESVRTGVPVAVQHGLRSS